jgi:hypothetical protein
MKSLVLLLALFCISTSFAREFRGNQVDVVDNNGLTITVKNEAAEIVLEGLSKGKRGAIDNTITVSSEESGKTVKGKHVLCTGVGTYELECQIKLNAKGKAQKF